MSQTTNHTDIDDRPGSVEELVEKHGRDVLERLADDGNIAAREALNLYDERTEETQ